MRTPGDGFELAAVLLVGDGRLRVSSRNQKLGDWPVKSVSARTRPDGCHIYLDGEVLIVTVPDPVLLADLINSNQSTVAEPDTSQTDPTEDVSAEDDKSSPWLTDMLARVPLSWKLGFAAVLLSILLLAFAPTALVGLLVLIATGLLVVGTLGHLDPFTAVRLPDHLDPSRLVSLGIAAVILALILAVSIG